MDITTKFDLGETAYPKLEAAKGNVIPVIVEKIEITVETTQIIVIVYQVQNTALFNGTKFNEDDLVDLTEAKVLACDALQTQIDSIQNEKDDLGC